MDEGSHRWWRYPVHFRLNTSETVQIPIHIPFLLFLLVIQNAFNDTDRAMDKIVVYASPSWRMNICGNNQNCHASGDFCHLLVAFANSLDPDQDQHFVGPDLDPNLLTL